MDRASNMPDTQQLTLLNSPALDQVLDNTQGDTPAAPEVRETGSPDEFCTPLQDLAPRKTTDDGENGKSDGTDKTLSKVLFTNPSEHNELVGANATRLEATPETPTMRRPQPQTNDSPCARNLADVMKRTRHTFEEGYDSDGEIGPFSHVVEEEGPQIFDEDALPNDLPKPSEAVNAGPEVENESSGTGHVPIALPTLIAMGKKELIVELKKRGQAIGGKKGELLERLQKTLAAKVVVRKLGAIGAIKKKANKKATGDNLNGFAPGSHWVPLIPIAAPIQEPENPTFIKARAPTVPEEEADVVKLKHDFSEKFDRPLFTGTHVSDKLWLTHTNGKYIKDANGLPQRVETPREKGEPNPEFVRRHKLSPLSHPPASSRLSFPTVQIRTTSGVLNTPQSKPGQNIQTTRLSAVKPVLEGQSTPSLSPSRWSKSDSTSGCIFLMASPPRQGLR
jgi:hypothetical protein